MEGDYILGWFHMVQSANTTVFLVLEINKGKIIRFENLTLKDFSVV